MVTCKAVEKFAFAEPFCPFRIRTTNGRTTDVLDEYSVFLGCSRLSLSPPVDPNASGFMESFPFDSIESLTRLETGERGDNIEVSGIVVECTAQPVDPVGRNGVEIGSARLGSEGQGMMTAHTVQAFVKAQPFRPFRIHGASGRTFDIRHPEMVKVFKTYLMVFKDFSNDTDFPEEFEFVSLMLTESISHLDASVA
jgi:hypothetical protein